MRLPMVVLPEPEAPTKATNCPGAISKDMPSSVGRDSGEDSAYRKLTLSNCTRPARPGISDGDCASGASTTAGLRSKYSKIRANSADEVCRMRPRRTGPYFERRNGDA